MISALLLAATLLQTPETEQTRIDIDVKEADALDVLRLLAESRACSRSSATS